MPVHHLLLVCVSHFISFIWIAFQRLRCQQNTKGGEEKDASGVLLNQTPSQFREKFVVSFI